MPQYKVTVTSIHAREMTVEASSDEEAIEIAHQLEEREADRSWFVKEDITSVELVLDTSKYELLEDQQNGGVMVLRLDDDLVSQTFEDEAAAVEALAKEEELSWAKV